MKRLSMRLLAGATLSGLAAAALVVPTAAQAVPSTPEGFCADGSQPMVTQDEVDATFDETTRVKGLTVVKGTTPVEFTGTYVASIKDGIATGHDMLLFQMEGAGIDEATSPTGRPAGIWAGMSGSPVYTQDGRLIGAVAYGLSGDDIALAGVTPADYMKETGADRVKATPASVRVTAKNLDAASPRLAQAATGRTLQQLKAVKVVTGGAAGNKLANRTLARVPKGSPAARTFKSGGFQPLGAPRRIAEPIVPGGNIAVGYATGDIFAGGVGTVTAVCGNDVWAFGHPMDYWGETALSLHNASAATIVTDSTGWGSYKQVSTVGQQVGTITEDGYAAIKGQLGVVKGFPAVTKVVNAKGELVKTYRGTVVDPDWADIAVLGPARAVQESLDNLGIGTVRLSWKIDYRHPKGTTGSLRNWQIYSDYMTLADSAVSDLGNDIAQIAYTDLGNAKITGVTATLTLLDRQPTEYRYVGAQVWTGKKWVKLNGRTLKKNRTHVVRPVIRKYARNKPQGLSYGPYTKFKMGSKAQGRGSVTFTPKQRSGGEEFCYEEDGDVICEEFGGETEAPKTFAQLIEQLDALIPANRGQALVSWNYKSGKTTGKRERTTGSVALGVNSGEYQSTFRVDR